MGKGLAGGLLAARSRCLSLPNFLHCSSLPRRSLGTAVTGSVNLVLSFIDTVWAVIPPSILWYTQAGGRTGMC